MRSIRMLGLALVGTLALAGCGGDDDGGRGFGPGNQGSMNATVTGDVTATLSGIAAFSVFDDDPDLFELLLMSGTLVDATHVIDFAREGGRPANGNYPIGDAAGNMYGSLYVESTGAVFYFTGGSVNITSSGPGGVSGNFTVQGEDIDGNTVSITGNFSSECISDSEEGLGCG